MSMTAALSEMHADASKRHEVSRHTSGKLRHHFRREKRTTNAIRVLLLERATTVTP